jgi:hypothetical protein
VLADTGEFEPALRHFEEALALLRQTQRGQSFYEASTLRAMAWLHVKQVQPAKALSRLHEAARIQDSILGNAFAAGSERQRKASAILPFVVLHEILTLVSRHFRTAPDAVRAAFNVLLRRKGIIVEALAVQRDGVLGDRHPELRPALQTLSACRAEIARLLLGGPGASDPAWHQQRISGLRENRERLEAELAQTIPEIRLAESFRTADVAAVAAAIPKGHALVEFVRFFVCSFWGRAQVETGKTMHYLAFVLRAGQPDSLRMVDLGDAAQIDAIVARVRSALGASGTGRHFEEGKENSADDEKAGEELRHAVFDPICEAVGDCRRLILAPDGDLNFIPFEILPAEGFRRLIDDWHFSYATAARDLLRFDGRVAGTSTGAFVAGDPNYDLAAGAAASAEVPGSREETVVVEEGFGKVRRDLGRSYGPFEPLRGSRREAARIAELLGVKALFDDEVTKECIASARAPRILHLATHGFFLESSDPSATSAATLSTDRMTFLSQQMENPLLRSGMALAGANTWLKFQPLPAEAGNGLLTAEDVTGLDLLDTELVVLSACETGLGTKDLCEGVMGLRRSFGLAGASTIVMSLWKVSDDVTQELMVEFYERILRGAPKAEALHEAQLAVKKMHDKPYFWGAFICHGDPGPLLMV